MIVLALYWEGNSDHVDNHDVRWKGIYNMRELQVKGLEAAAQRLTGDLQFKGWVG